MYKQSILILVIISLLYPSVYNFDGNQHFGNKSYLITDILISNSFTLSSHPDMIGNKYCEGSFTFVPNLNSKWAINSFEASSYYYDFPSNKEECIHITPSSPSNCPPYPIEYTNINHNNPIKWLSNSDYSSGTDYFDSGFSSSPSQILSTFHNEKILKYFYMDFDEGGNPVYFYNEKGGVNIFCDGHYKFYNDGSVDSNQNVVNLPAYSYTTNLESGTHTIKSELSGVNCFGVIKVLPLAPGFFRMYSFSDDSLNINPEGYTYPQINVLPNKDFSFSYSNLKEINIFGAEQDLPVCFDSEGSTSKLVKLSITNTGDVAGELTSIQSNNAGFTLSPLFVQDWVFDDNKNYISPGETKDVIISISYDSQTPIPDQISFSVTLTPLTEFCNPNGEVTNLPFILDDIPIPTCLDDYHCVLSPHSIDEMVVDDSYIVSFLGCFNGQNQITCNNLDWTLTPNDWEMNPIPYIIGNGKVVIPKSIGSGSLTLNAVADGNPVECSTTLSTTTNPEIPNSGPIVINPAHTPNPANNSVVVNITATGDDTKTGNDNISHCEINLDGIGWSEVEPTDNHFDSPIEDFYYVAGILDEGTHIALMRCTDVEGYTGNVITYTFNIFNDSESDVPNSGPIVSNIIYYPTYPDISIINATGDDTKTGNDNISHCEIMLDGNLDNWNPMNAVDGEFNSPVEELYYDGYKNLEIGEHKVSIHCTDNKNYKGGDYNYTFNLGEGYSCEINQIPSMNNLFGQYDYKLKCFDFEGDETDCSNVEGVLNSDVSWNLELRPSYLPYTFENGEDSYSKTLNIIDYLGVKSEQEVSANITAEITSNNVLYPDGMECSLNYLLPDIYCELFV